MARPPDCPSPLLSDVRTYSVLPDGFHRPQRSASAALMSAAFSRAVDPIEAALAAAEAAFPKA